MARTVKNQKLDSRTARLKLAPNEHHWVSLDRELHLGYRRGVRGGNWTVRVYVDGTYRQEGLGIADDTLDSDGDVILDFSSAQAKARDRSTQIRREVRGLPKQSKGYTVSQCLADYIDAWAREETKHKRGGTLRDPRKLQYVTKRINAEIGDVEVALLTEPRLSALKTKLAEARSQRVMGRNKVVILGPVIETEQRVRQRRSTANRVLALLKAAMNHAVRKKRVVSTDIWKHFEFFDAKKPKDEYEWLDVEEATRLINACDEPSGLRDLVRAALMTGARLAELCRLDVKDFGHNSGTLHIKRSKSGKSRDLYLTDEARDFFASLCVGRPGDEPLLRRWITSRRRYVDMRSVKGHWQIDPNPPPASKATRWKTGDQYDAFREALHNARIGKAVSFHSLRHTWASLAVMNGMPLMIVAENLGHSGLTMVQEVYGHLAKSFVANEIRSRAPRFDITPSPNNVEPLRIAAASGGDR